MTYDVDVSSPDYLITRGTNYSLMVNDCNDVAMGEE